MEERRDRNDTAVVIIGAGISGMCAAIDLIRRTKTRDFIILEKGTSVGGTWSDNKYPGCCCDVWSHLYSFSFEGNPNWTEHFPGQEEIHAYLVDIAERWGLYKNIRFGTLVEEATWDSGTSSWQVKVLPTASKDAEYSEGYTISSSFLLSGVGQLNQPQYPKIPGIESFKGRTMHSARWDWSHALNGKKIGIIGSGATSCQIVPEVTKVASGVVVFQRTPNWVVPRGQRKLGPLLRWLFKVFPFVRRFYRRLLMDFREYIMTRLVVQTSAVYEKYVIQQSKDHLERQIPGNEKLRSALLPKYSPGCKRIIPSDDIYPALNQQHVTLETNEIESITPDGIQVTGNHHDLDLIIFATGFRTLEFMYPIKIYGVRGRSLQNIWATSARAYLGMTVECLPNFAMLYGPNTNLGHNSVILMIEAQSRYINTLIAPILKARAEGKQLSFLPSPERLQKYNTDLQEILKTTSFADPRCNSWYKNEDGVITNNWSGGVFEYQKLLSTVVWKDYVVDGDSSQIAKLKGKKHIGNVIEGNLDWVLRIVVPYSALALVGIVIRNKYFK